MVPKLLQFTFLDLFLGITVAACFFASFRMERVITSTRARTNRLAETQSLLAPPAVTGLAVRRMPRKLGSLSYRIHSSRALYLVAETVDDHNITLRHDIASIPSGEHVIEVNLAGYVSGHPSSMIAKRFTCGKEMDVSEWGFPDGLRSLKSSYRGERTDYTTSRDGIELCLYDCGVEKIHLILRPRGW